jgi:hydroxypyruvate isomerase
MPSRRNFLKNGVLAAAAVPATTLSSFAVSPRANRANPFKLLYAPHFGMFKHSAGDDLIDQLKFMHDEGFRAMEDNGMMGRTKETQEKIARQMQATDMKMGVFVIDGGDNWKVSLTTGKDEFKETFLKTCRQALEVAKRVNARWMTVVPGYFERNLPLGIQTAHVVDALRRAADIFEPHNLSMVLEPLSDNPDLFLRYSTQTYEICKAVNSPACKILFDMYHMQKNEGRMTYHMDQTWDEIAYFQIGDEPGRKEPTTGEINYRFLFKHIAEKAQENKQEFILGMEHGNFFPGKEGERKLIEAYRWSDNF